LCAFELPAGCIVGRRTVTDTATERTEPSPAGTRQKRRPARSWGFGLFLMGMCVLWFLAGSTVAEFRVFPYREFLSPSFDAARATLMRLRQTSSLRATNLWSGSTFRVRGVVHHEPGKSLEGYTFYTSGHTSGALLIDMEGRVVHEWNVPFSTAWERPSHVPFDVPDRFVYWRRAHLYPNGDVLALYVAGGVTPWGYGLVKVDRDSNILWRFAEQTHHDLHVAADGTIYTLTHAWRDTHRQPVAGAPHLAKTVMDDFVVRLSPEGEPLGRVGLLDAFAKSPYHHLLTSIPEDQWDVLHTNTVKVLTPAFAAHHDFAEPGQVLLSFRNRDALALLDFGKGKITWASCGPYRRQHDPDPLDNGRILLFDNQGHAGPGGPSRLIEFDPATQAIAWSYAGDDDHFFFSLLRSTQQLLPNGNVLVTESDRGRLFEMTRKGQFVWDYRNPATLDGDLSTIAVLSGAARFLPEKLHFELNGPATTPMKP